MHRAFVEKPWIDLYLGNQAQTLPPDVATRFFKILRIKADEQVAVFDGHGRQITGILAKDGLVAYFSSSSFHEEKKPKPSITLMQAAIDEAKISETIKRGCEFGFDKFIIFEAEHSEKYCFAKLKKRENRLKLLAIDACRQSGRMFVPPIEFIENLALNEQTTAIFGEPSAQSLLSELLVKNDLRDEIVVLIGPEGGWSKGEIDKLKSKNAFATRFAPYVLRSELASLAAIALINARLQRA